MLLLTFFFMVSTRLEGMNLSRPLSFSTAFTVTYKNTPFSPIDK